MVINYIVRMVKAAINEGAKLQICGSCAEARGLRNTLLVEVAELSAMAENWVVDSDKILTF